MMTHRPGRKWKQAARIRIRSSLSRRKVLEPCSCDNHQRRSDILHTNPPPPRSSYFVPDASCTPSPLTAPQACEIDALLQHLRSVKLLTQSLGQASGRARPLCRDRDSPCPQHRPRAPRGAGHTYIELHSTFSAMQRLDRNIAMSLPACLM